ncbi:MAG: clostripain-related cysteine peptidase [Oligoflexia bacterium]|nr:clostripain-related cysteine peptidase [Oligoflexia bacterium]
MDLILAIIVSVLLWQEAKAAPQWFPKKPCDINSSNYDFTKDVVKTSSGNLGYKEFAHRSQRRNCYKPWTVLVFMTVGEDLKPFALWDIAEMERSGGDQNFQSASTIKSDVVVEYTKANTPLVKRLHLFESKTKSYEGLNETDFYTSTDNDIESPVVTTFNRKLRAPLEANLSRFLKWGVREYPATNYMVVIWGHGTGWKAKKQNDQALYGNVPLLGQAVRSAVNQSLEGKPIDIFISDACLMQTVEVVNEISDVTRYIIGSAQVQPYSGLPYGRIMAALNSDKNFGPQQVELMAKLIPELSQVKITETLSTISSFQLRSKLVPALYELSNQLHNYISVEPIRRLKLQQVVIQTPGYLGGFKESGDYLALLDKFIREEDISNQNNIALKTAIENVNQALDLTVIRSVLGSQHSKQARGLSIWLPETKEELLLRHEEFKRSTFYTNGWGEWLGALYGFGGLGELTIKFN